MYSIERLLDVMVKSEASDLYISLGAYPMLKIEGETIPIEEEKITAENLEQLRQSLMNENQQAKFDAENELDFALSFPGLGRFRINYFMQRGSEASVIHHVLEQIKSIEELNLPVLLNELALQERGLLLIVGAVGSGKSTTLAALVDNRNQTMAGHILTLEDPIEFLHQHKKSIVNQREIGQDTYSYRRALKSALREAPSLLLMGEIRDIESMAIALNFAETGHLVLSTLHAANTTQAVERMLSLHDVAFQDLIRMQLSENLTAIVAQRLVPTIEGGRIPATEILLPSARIRDLIRKGDTHLLHHSLEFAISDGMQSFDQCLHQLYRDEKITKETAIRFYDRTTDLKMKILAGEKHEITSVIELVTDEE
ncbi:MAG: PilT/PilU family type 4a pilus ATPase [Candidatus Neomarinimicrobiota bacterium]